jgi:hypothetical protein
MIGRALARDIGAGWACEWWPTVGGAHHDSARVAKAMVVRLDQTQATPTCALVCRV